MIRARAASRRGALAFLLAATIAAPAHSAPAAREAPEAQATREASGIPRFAEIEPGLARGGQPDHGGLRFLRDQGYRTVVSFRKNPEERRELEKLGIVYVEIPMHAGLSIASIPTEEDLRRFFSVLGDSARRPVFIHCSHGKDRTGAMAAIYRIQSCGWTAEEAVREMKSHGFSGHYRKLMRFVREYARRPSLDTLGRMIR